MAFTENEKLMIRSKLLEAAEVCMQKYGIRKTTVDELVKRAGISKGAFYLFYSTKEVLFFDVFEAYQEKMTQQLATRLDLASGLKKQQFIEVIYALYQEVKDSFILNIIESDELEYLMRKLPPEFVTHHQGIDNMFTEALFSALDTNSEYDTELISAAFRAVFMTMLHQKEIGQTQYNAVLKLLISALADRIIKE